MTDTYLAIDQGGQSSRAFVYDRSGQVLGRGAAAVKTVVTGNHVEHDATELLNSVMHAVNLAVTAASTQCQDLPVALGLATQRSSIVCWDITTGKALSPVISWRDTRGARALAAMGLDVAEIQRITGLVPAANYGASKIAWCLENLTPVQQAARNGSLAIGPLASFLLYQLLEERPFKVDPGNAARTLLWDREQRDWSDLMLARFGIPREILPSSVANRDAFGTLRIAGGTIPLNVCVGDQGAAIFAGGMPEAGAVFINMGTGVFIQAIAERSVNTSAGILSSLAFSDNGRAIVVLEGAVNGGVAALAQVGADLKMDQQYIDRELPAWLSSDWDVPGFLNGVGGLGSPYWRGDFVSRLVGDNVNNATLEAKLVAVIESIVFMIVINIEAMALKNIPSITVSGGLAHLDGLCERLCILLDRTLNRSDDLEASARGLGYLVAGEPAEWGGNQDPSVIFTPQGTTIDQDALRHRYQIFCTELKDALNVLDG